MMNVAHKPIPKQQRRVGAVSKPPFTTLKAMGELHKQGFVDLVPVRKASLEQDRLDLFVTQDHFKHSAKNRPEIVALLKEGGTGKVFGWVYEGRRHALSGVKTGETRLRKTPEIVYPKGGRRIALSSFIDPKTVRTHELGRGVKLEDSFDGIIGTEAPLKGKDAPKLLLTVTFKNNEKRYFYENRRAEN